MLREVRSHILVVGGCIKHLDHDRARGGGVCTKKTKRPNAWMSVKWEPLTPLVSGLVHHNRVWFVYRRMIKTSLRLLWCVCTHNVFFYNVYSCKLSLWQNGNPLSKNILIRICAQLVTLSALDYDSFFVLYEGRINIYPNPYFIPFSDSSDRTRRMNRAIVASWVWLNLCPFLNNSQSMISDHRILQ